MRLRRTKDLTGYTLGAIDTDIGSVQDFYFDDQRWTIRYIVVGTGIIFSGRKVLISPLALRRPAWSPLHIYVNLTREQVQNSPSIELHQPVSRQQEMEHHKHYELPYYWEGTSVWGFWPDPQALLSAQQARLDAPPITARTGANDLSDDTHLRSAHEVRGYHVKVTDGEIGHVEDFLFDDETWEIRYVIVDTRNWWPGKKVLLRPQWIKNVNWATREFHTAMGREMIAKSPAWDPDSPVSPEYELHLHHHYGYAPDWTVDNIASGVEPDQYASPEANK
jgi:hypothetical protein